MNKSMVSDRLPNSYVIFIFSGITSMTALKSCLTTIAIAFGNKLRTSPPLPQSPTPVFG
ncbi:hypothetical protein H6G96_31530 [Nostoc sp. FACHB-892]|uniref:hypothetical protein n=1 Tax=Nostoc sp. FACHB-892 TaxID=2692843 RepID=UPI0016878CEE|nr:hypothetical protein [Nostoc sp. FACHB-892]MBD2730728.1 hypothetical protein [Nostoc sp. FACHB-892]